MPGLLLNGAQRDVAGVSIINPLDGVEWCHLSRMDCRPRTAWWVRQIILHTTKGEWPQRVIPGKGPANRDERVAKFWQGSTRQSAAHIVIDSDGTAACLADLLATEAYHATVVNRWSVGIEIYQEAGGGIYQAALDSAVLVVFALCRLFGIPPQIPARPYKRGPLARLKRDGGPMVVGVFGHRDVTDNRGQGDPGEAIWDALERAGAHAFDFASSADVSWWKSIQTAIGTDADGVPGPATMGRLATACPPEALWALAGGVAEAPPAP